MQQVDFYVLSGNQTREHFVCRLAEKAWSQGLRVHIQADSPQQAGRLDDLLWTFRDISFVPHDRYPEVAESAAPVRIAWGPQASPGIRDLLITLAADIPAFFNEFARVAEVLDADPAIRAAGRERYRLYRERGAQLKYHEL